MAFSGGGTMVAVGPDLAAGQTEQGGEKDTDRVRALEFVVLFLAKGWSEQHCGGGVAWRW